jgi:26S proteasome regulatory subunit T6
MFETKGNIIDDFYDTKIKEIELKVKAKQINFMRLQAQRNDLNEKVIKIRDELKHLLKPGNEVAEVIKILGKDKVLVKASSDGKYIVKVDDSKVNIEDLRPNLRVTLGEGKKINRILPNRVDPLVSLMKVEKVPDATYDMVGGLDKQIKEIREVIELPIKHPEVFESLGISQPKGVLMYGPPGTGKTLLAKACAHHTDCCFIRVSGNELVQKYIGEGARLVRELFVMARQHAPSIIFMDEIDSIGGHRISSDSESKGDSEVQRTMLELLNQLDGFEETQNIKMIMATNRIDILDDALLRPGRIDRKIEFPNPNEKARYDILKIHSRKMNLVRGVDLLKIAGMLIEASGADCKAVCSEAGMFALRERRMHVTQEDFEMAVAKVMKKDDDKNQLKKIWK